MIRKFFFGFLVLVVVFASLTGIVYENFWLKKVSEIVFFLPLLGFYFTKISFENHNFSAFLILSVAATVTSCLDEYWFFDHVTLGFWLGAYIFLVREALRYTEYEKGSRFTTLYFVAVVVLYAYLLSEHILEIERRLSDNFELSLYIIYYLNILIFAITALVYYLNSFSRKSVFFICLTLSFFFADILRDMEVFYFRDLSVEVVGSLIKFGALCLVFLFFVTPEKKLRLLHLV